MYRLFRHTRAGGTVAGSLVAHLRSYLVCFMQAKNDVVEHGVERWKEQMINKKKMPVSVLISLRSKEKCEMERCYWYR